MLDSAEQARAVADASRAAGVAIPALVEIDCDGHRAGLKPDDPAVVEVGRLVADGAELRGVMTHAGGSYFAHGDEELRAAADGERDAVVLAAERLRDAGLPCPVVSVGSTPTAFAATDLTGVTEVRAGTYAFHDAVMLSLGVCAVEEIALSVAVTVIGHRRDKGWILTDGGWMATSYDHGRPASTATASSPTSPGTRSPSSPCRAPTRSTASSRSARAATPRFPSCPSAPACGSSRATPARPPPSTASTRSSTDRRRFRRSGRASAAGEPPRNDDRPGRMTRAM